MTELWPGSSESDLGSYEERDAYYSQLLTNPESEEEKSIAELARLSKEYREHPYLYLADETPVSEKVWRHWFEVCRRFDGQLMHGSMKRFVALRLSCPSCEKKLTLLGLDRDLSSERSHYVWHRPYRRVTSTFSMDFDSEMEGIATDPRRLEIDCPVSKCRGRIEWRLHKIVLVLHRLKKAHEDNESDTLVFDYIP